MPPKSNKKIIPSPPKAPTIGDKQRAGRLLSEHLRKIAQEETEFVIHPDGDRMVSKAEALARLMFKLALGYEEIKDGGKVELTTRLTPTPREYMATTIPITSPGRFFWPNYHSQARCRKGW